MTEFFNLVVAGLVTGALYAILASGLTLSYQTSGIFNFGQGGVAFATAYLFFQLNTGQGLPIVPSAIICIAIFAPLLGWLLHLVLFNPLRGASIAARMVASLGLLIALPSLGLWIVALLKQSAHMDLPAIEDVFRIPGLGPSPKKIYKLGSGLIIDSDQLAMLGAAIFAAVLLWYLVRHTRIGLEMRASVSRPNLAALRGVDPDRASAVSWVTSCGLAGLVGVLLAPMFGLSSFSYNTLLFISIPAVVLGRMASIPAAMGGGLLLGVAQNLIDGYVDVDIVGFRTAVPFIILFGLLIYFGAERGRSAGTTIEEKPSAEEVGTDAPPWRRRGLWAVLTIGLLAYTAWGASNYYAGLLAQGLAMAIVLLSFTVVTGIGGMVSLAQAAFVLSGAFTAGILLGHGWPFLPALLVGTLVSAVIGLIVALPTRRLGGLPLALSTLALAYVGQNLLFQIHSISNGSGGWPIHPPAIGKLDTANPRWLVLLMVILLGLGVWVVHALRQSSTGRAMLATRSTEVGARTSGIAVDRMKLLVFVISAGIAGFGGVMLAASRGRVTNTDYDALLGMVWLATTVTLSIRRPAGAVIAGLVTVLFPVWLNSVPASSYFMQMLFGLGAIGLARDPEGGLAAGARVRRERAARARAKAAIAAVAASGAQAATAPAAPVATASLVKPPTAQAQDGAEPLLRVTGLKAGYDEIEVLHGVDLAIAPGKALALLGSNGAGKTTLCSVIGGLVPARAGTVWLAGRDVTKVPARRRERDSIYLAPEGRGVFPDLTVEENLTIWLRDAAEREAAYAAFPVLADRRRQAAGTMSGGEQQLLTLAPALVRPPKLLVADEPSLGLAPLIIEQVFEALRELQRQGTTLLIAEEKTRDALAIADQVAFLTVGDITWSGPVSEVNSERLSAAYLGIADASNGAAPAGAAARQNRAVATSSSGD